MLSKLFGLIKYNHDWMFYLQSKYKSLEPDKLLTFRLRNGQSVTLRADARFILNEIFLDSAYDIPGVNFSACKSILDIGANMGIYTLYAAAKAPQSSLYCFEPNTQNFAILEQNIRKNNISAKAYKLAVSDTCQMGHLQVDKSSVEYRLGASSATSELVECVDLEEVFKLTGVATFDFMKMDIEGAEREIFNNSSDALLLRFKALAIEWHHSWEELENLAERFRKLGFIAQPELVQGHIRYLMARQA